MEEKSTSIMDKIFELLTEKGISQRELSDLTGISTSAISDWKHKGSTPSAYNVKKICEALNVDAEEIIGNRNSAKEGGIVIDKNDDLFEFVNSYRGLDESAQKRILAYAMTMMKQNINSDWKAKKN